MIHKKSELNVKKHEIESGVCLKRRTDQWKYYLPHENQRIFEKMEQSPTFFFPDDLDKVEKVKPTILKTESSDLLPRTSRRKQKACLEAQKLQNPQKRKKDEDIFLLIDKNANIVATSTIFCDSPAQDPVLGKNLLKDRKELAQQYQIFRKLSQSFPKIRSFCPCTSNHFYSWFSALFLNKTPFSFVELHAKPLFVDENHMIFEPSPLYLVFLAQKRLILESVLKPSLLMFILLLSCAGLGAIVVIKLSSLVTEPLQKLANKVNALSELDFTTGSTEEHKKLLKQKIESQKMQNQNLRKKILRRRIVQDGLSNGEDQEESEQEKDEQQKIKDTMRNKNISIPFENYEFYEGIEELKEEDESFSEIDSPTTHEINSIFQSFKNFYKQPQQVRKTKRFAYSSSSEDNHEMQRSPHQSPELNQRSPRVSSESMRSPRPGTQLPAATSTAPRISPNVKPMVPTKDALQQRRLSLNVYGLTNSSFEKFETYTPSKFVEKTSSLNEDVETHSLVESEQIGINPPNSNISNLLSISQATKEAKKSLQNLIQQKTLDLEEKIEAITEKRQIFLERILSIPKKVQELFHSFMHALKLVFNLQKKNVTIQERNGLPQINQKNFFYEIASLHNSIDRVERALVCFEKYSPSGVLKKVLKERSLGNPISLLEARDISVVFTDVNNFTNITGFSLIFQKNFRKITQNCSI